MESYSIMILYLQIYQKYTTSENCEENPEDNGDFVVSPAYYA